MDGVVTRRLMDQVLHAINCMHRNGKHKRLSHGYHSDSLREWSTIFVTEPSESEFRFNTKNFCVLKDLFVLVFSLVHVDDFKITTRKAKKPPAPLMRANL